MTGQTADYIYIQLAESIHEDRPRILTASGENSQTIYISGLTDSEAAVLNELITAINTRLTGISNPQ